MIGLSVERLTQDKIRWHPDDIANIQTIANRWGAAGRLAGLGRCLGPQLGAPSGGPPGLAVAAAATARARPQRAAEQLLPPTKLDGATPPPASPPSRPWALQLLAKSLAPSIYGHQRIKEGLVMMLMGGMERYVNNSHIRWGGGGAAAVPCRRCGCCRCVAGSRPRPLPTAPLRAPGLGAPSSKPPGVTSTACSWVTRVSPSPSCSER